MNRIPRSRCGEPFLNYAVHDVVSLPRSRCGEPWHLLIWIDWEGRKSDSSLRQHGTILFCRLFFACWRKI